MAKVPRNARFQNNRDDSVTFWFPYHPELVRRIKAIPREYRHYNPDDDNSWQVWPPYVDTALRAFFDFHVGAPGYDEEPPRSYTRPQSWQDARDPYAVLFLLPTAPLPVVDASFRALAKTYHPDCGGDAAKMRAIAEARDTITRRLGA